MKHFYFVVSTYRIRRLPLQEPAVQIISFGLSFHKMSPVNVLPTTESS